MIVPRRPRRRLAKGQRDLTAGADVIYRAAFFGEGLPEGWRVIRFEKRTRWHGAQIGPQGYHGAAGRCSWRLKTILLHRCCWQSGGLHSERAVPSSGWLGILLHEMIHMRCPGLKHGREFNDLTRQAWERLWETAQATPAARPSTLTDSPQG